MKASKYAQKLARRKAAPRQAVTVLIAKSGPKKGLIVGPNYVNLDKNNQVEASTIRPMPFAFQLRNNN